MILIRPPQWHLFVNAKAVAVFVICSSDNLFATRLTNGKGHEL